MSRLRARLPLVALGALCCVSCAVDVELTRAPTPSLNGDRWVIVDSGTTADLRAISGTSPDDLWAVGDRGTILHWNGSAWRAATTPMPSVSLTGVWAVSTTDVWVVGAEGGDARVLHGDGTNWTPVPMPPRTSFTPRAVWASSASDVWIAGTAPTEPPLQRWNGSELRPEFTPGPRPTELSGVAGTGPNDVWVVGGSRIFHRLGGWTSPTPPGSPSFAGPLCTAGGSLWVALQGGGALRFSGGGGWMPSSPPGTETLRGLWCNRGDDVWAVDGSNRALHFHGASWSTEALPRGGASALWSGGGELWIVGAAGLVLRSNP